MTAPNRRYPNHPFADLFPLMGDVDLGDLAEDLEAHGLRVPIVLYQGNVLDGRNRLRACERVGVEPRFETFEGTDDQALALVLSLNLTRRHLSTAQRAALAVRLLPHEQALARQRMLAGRTGSPPQEVGEGRATKVGEATELAGSRVGVSRETVRQAVLLSENAPDVFAAMASGTVATIPDAIRLGSVTPERRGQVLDLVRAGGVSVKDAISTVFVDCAPPTRVSQPTETRGERHRLLYGRHVLDALGELPDGTVHACCTSPPFWAVRSYGSAPEQWAEVTFSPAPNLPSLTIPAQEASLGGERDPWAYVGHLVEVFRGVRRVLHDEGSLWLNLGCSYVSNPTPDVVNVGGVEGERIRANDNYLRSRTVKTRPRAYQMGDWKFKDLLGIPWMVAQALQADGWWLRAEVVWHAENSHPEKATDRPMRAHQQVFLLSKSQDYHFDQAACPRRSVWMVNHRHVEAGGHPAVWPEQLVENLVLASTRKDEVVLDPFSGSATTGVVALRHDRQYVGIDLNGEYLAGALTRIRGVEKGT